MRDRVDPFPIVRDHDDGAALGGLSLDESLDEIHRIPVERRMGFVEQEQRAIDHEFAGELGAPLHAMRRCSGSAINGAGETYRRERLTGLLRRDTGNPGREAKVLAKREFGVETGDMADHPDSPPNVVPL